MATDLNQWAWSTTPADNATADAQINWAEGQDAATVNNSARAMMAAIAKMTDVQSGNVTVGGSADAITITTGQSISAGHQALGFRICFKASATNTGATTVAVDGLTAVAIKRPNNDALSAGDIVSGAFHDIAFDGTNYRLMVPGAAGSYGTLSGDNTWTGSNTFTGNVAVGNDATDAVDIMGQRVSVYGSQILTASSALAWRNALGLGTAATNNVSTEGANVPMLNGGNTWSATQAFVVASTSTTSVHIANTGTPWNASVYLAQFFNNLGIQGSITGTGTGSGVAFNTSSDYRLKTDIRDLDAGDIIDRIQPRRFVWKSNNHPAVGFIAHELQAVVPDAVAGEKDAVSEDGSILPQGVDASKLMPYLVAEIKALRARVAALEAGDSS